MGTISGLTWLKGPLKNAGMVTYSNTPSAAAMAADAPKRPAGLLKLNLSSSQTETAAKAKTTIWTMEMRSYSK